MKEVFKKKYLEYEPKITLEIFTLVWNRLIELGYKSFARATIEERYDEFKGRFNYFRATQNHPNEFNCYCDVYDCTKTTVEEILGYNPFIKETKPSKDWSKATDEKLLEEAKRRYPIGCKIKLIGDNVGGAFNNEVRFTKHKVYNSSKGKQLFVDGNLLLFDKTWAKIISLPEVNSTLGVNLIDTSSFKPSTKEAFDAQDKTKPIEKWSVGSYVVFLQDEVLTRSDKVTKGKVYKLTSHGSVRYPYFHDDNGSLVNFVSKDSDKYGLKWFATEHEAEEFAKTLVEPAKEKVKQAVHCKTQEEWDFFILKEVSKSHTMSKEPFQKDSAITFNNSWDRVDYLKNNGYQILSFQEWCDLNGYKMKKELKPDGHFDKISSVKDTGILNESSIGKFISFKYNNRFYNKALIVKENGNIYLLNNCHPNNDGHKDKSVYKYSLKYCNFYEVKTLCREIKFLTTEEAPKPKMILSIDDEELPMVNIIKTNSLKQLLNND